MMKNTITTGAGTTTPTTITPTATETKTTTHNLFINAPEICAEMGISRSYAYRIIKQLNGELSSRGFLVIQGKTSRKYFYERIYGMAC